MAELVNLCKTLAYFIASLLITRLLYRVSFLFAFKDNSKLIQTISALFYPPLLLVLYKFRLVAGGKLFETVFGLDYTYAVIIGTVCVVSYTLFGGFLAVAWTDLIQGLIDECCFDSCSSCCY